MFEQITMNIELHLFSYSWKEKQKRQSRGHQPTDEDALYPKFEFEKQQDVQKDI